MLRTAGKLAAIDAGTTNVPRRSRPDHTEAAPIGGHFAAPEIHHRARGASLARQLHRELRGLARLQRIARRRRDFERNLLQVRLDLLHRHRPRFELVGLQHRLLVTLPRDVQHPGMALIRRLAGEVLAAVLLLLERFAGGGIQPLYVIAVLFHRHFDRRAGMLDVVHILDVFQRHRARAVDIEVRLQLPMPRVGHEIEPIFRDIGVFAAKLRIFAVHGGVPQMLCVGNSDERNRIELMFHRTDGIVL